MRTVAFASLVFIGAALGVMLGGYLGVRPPHDNGLWTWEDRAGFICFTLFMVAVFGAAGAGAGYRLARALLGKTGPKGGLPPRRPFRADGDNRKRRR